MVIVDTSAWVEFFRRQGDPKVKLAVKGLLDAYEATLCGPVEMEFLGGVREEEKKLVQSWFNVVPYARNDQKVWRKAAELYGRMSSKGHKIPWNDALIATITLEKGCRVYAVDKHFEAMSRHVGVILYRPGYNGTFSPDNDQT
jgi:predicted nucleic acid-binding protein